VKRDAVVVCLQAHWSKAHLELHRHARRQHEGVGELHEEYLGFGQGVAHFLHAHGDILYNELASVLATFAPSATSPHKPIAAINAELS
jgi:hypothetical protein